MKKILAIGLGILILFAVYVMAAQTTERPEKAEDIIVTFISQTPDPAEPGRYVDLRFKFENDGGDTAENVEAEILPQYPFSLDPGESAIKSLGSINTQQKDDKGVIIKYRLRVDKDALEGENEIKLRYRLDKGVWITLTEFTVNIQPYDALLLLDKVVSKPEVIRPGEKATIDVTFKNIAEILVRKIRVILKLGNVPLAPIGSTNEKVIEKIDKNDQETVRFDVVGEPDAQSGTYKVAVEYIYYDSLGNSYSRNSTIGIMIGSEPDLLVSIDATTIYQPEKTGDITIKIVNKDVNEIKFLNVKLAESEDYRIISPDEVYVGNIDSDDYETAEFTIFVKDVKEKAILPITLEYRDANNAAYEEKHNLELPMYSTSEAKKFGLVAGNGTIGIIVIIVVVVAGVFIYIRWRKGKKKKA